MPLRVSLLALVLLGLVASSRTLPSTSSSSQLSPTSRPSSASDDGAAIMVTSAGAPLHRETPPAGCISGRLDRHCHQYSKDPSVTFISTPHFAPCEQSIHGRQNCIGAFETHTSSVSA